MPVSKPICYLKFVFLQDKSNILTPEEMMYYKNMTEEKKKSYQEIFSIFDADGGGSIQNEEIMDVMRTLGQNPSP